MTTRARAHIFYAESAICLSCIVVLRLGVARDDYSYFCTMTQSFRVRLGCYVDVTGSFQLCDLLFKHAEFGGRIVEVLFSPLRHT